MVSEIKYKNYDMKKWRKENQEKSKVSQKKYWEKQAKKKISSDNQKVAYGG